MPDRPWLLVNKNGEGSIITWLTDEKALELLLAEVRIQPLGGDAALVRQLEVEAHA